jgi:hypothetical protein
MRFLRSDRLLPALALAGLVVAFVAPSPSGATTGTWTEFPAPARAGHSATHDPLRDRLVLFGGTETGIRRAEVWAFALSGAPTWSLIAQEGEGPSARAEHTAIYDPVRVRLLVFGGNDGSARNDLWALSLEGSAVWSEIATQGTPPSPRSNHTAVYDPVGDRMLVFGGGPTGGDTETYSLALATTPPTWSVIPTTGDRPAARSSHAATYDAGRQWMLIFGGPTRNDLWALRLGGTATATWTQIIPPGPQPQGRMEHLMFYDPVRDRIFVGSGTWFPGFYYGIPDAWSLSLASGEASWQPAAGKYRWAYAGFYDPLRDALVIQGGNSDRGNHNEVLQLPLAGGGEWQRLSPSSLWLPSLYGHTSVYDPVAERMVVFGGAMLGCLDACASRATSIHSLTADPGWGQFLEFGPEELYNHTSIYDPVRHRMLVFGGGDFYSPLSNRVWALSLAPNLTWSQVTVTGTPPAARAGHSAIYDPVRDRMLIFGGANEVQGWGTRYNDVWELALSPGSPAWTLLHPQGTPPSARVEHTAIYDPIGDRMLVFGGRAPGEQNDLWALSLAGPLAWTPVDATGTPPSPRSQHTGIYDADRARMVVFAGTPAGDAFALDLSDPLAVTWEPLAVEGTPPGGRIDHSAIYDESAGRMVVFGGTNGTSAPTVMALEFAGPLAVSPPTAPAATGLTLHAMRPNPSRGALTLDFDLPGSARSTLALIDVTGRRVAARDLGVLGPGSQSLRIDDLGIPSGVYFLELTHGGQSLTRKVSILR